MFTSTIAALALFATAGEIHAASVRVPPTPTVGDGPWVTKKPIALVSNNATNAALTRNSRSADCADLSTDCPAWSYMGYCEESSPYAPYMSENCKVSCGECGEVECGDLHKDCNAWEAMGYCTSNDYASYMSTNCKESCRQCGTCGNDDSNCDAWASLGYCLGGEYKNYMSKHCPLACDICPDTDSESNNNGSNDTDSESNNNGSNDTDSESNNNGSNDGAETDEFCNDREGRHQCKIWWDRGYCEESSSFYSNMVNQCAHTCGHCKAPENIVPIDSLGKDCSGFQTIGDFYGHVQLKEGSTMSSGTLIFTIYESWIWRKSKRAEHSDINAIQMELRTAPVPGPTSQKLYRIPHEDNWTLEKNARTVRVYLDQPKEFPGRSPTVELDYNINLDSVYLAFNIYTCNEVDNGRCGHSIQMGGTLFSEFF